MSTTNAVSATDARESRSRPHSTMVILVLAYSVFFLMPGDLVFVGPLRSNGAPLRLLGMAAFFLVLVGFLHAQTRQRARPAAWIVVGYGVVCLVAWASANTRPLSSFSAAGMDRTVLIYVAGAGLALLATVTVDSTRRAHVLIGCLAAGACFAGFVAAFQVAGVINVWTDFLRIPFMTTVVPSMGVSARAGLNRATGPTSSPLEYSVCMAAVLPLVIHLMLHARSANARRWSGVAAGVILLCLPLGLSRSGVLTLVVALVVFMVFLRAAQGWLLVGATVVAAIAAPVIAPAVTGAFVELVVNAGEDDSIEGRLGDYPAVMALFNQSPLLGNGPVTNNPLMPDVLDNQWLLTLVRDGLVGVAGLALLVVGGAMLAARIAWRSAEGSAARTMNGALCAGLVALAVAAGTFDLLAFQQATFLIFLLLGLVGSVSDEPADGLSQLDDRRVLAAV